MKFNEFSTPESMFKGQTAFSFVNVFFSHESLQVRVAFLDMRGNIGWERATIDWVFCCWWCILGGPIIVFSAQQLSIMCKIGRNCDEHTRLAMQKQPKSCGQQMVALYKCKAWLYCLFFFIKLPENFGFWAWLFSNSSVSLFYLFSAKMSAVPCLCKSKSFWSKPPIYAFAKD